MRADGIASLLAALSRDKPGVLGAPWFYLLLAALYLALVAGLLIWWVVRLRRGEELQPRRGEAILLVALALAHGLIYSVVNPPWFAPDEPSHFEYAQRLADLGRVPALADRSEALHGEILASMYAFDYWPNNGMPAPEHAPVAFAAGLSGDWQGIPPSFVVDDRFLWYYPQIGNEPPAYYFWVQPAFWVSGDLLARHYAVRWLTVLLYAASVGLIYGAASHALGHIPGGAAGATATALLQPMFAYMGSAINNDMAAVFLASAWFALAVPLFVGSGEWAVGSREAGVGGGVWGVGGAVNSGRATRTRLLGSAAIPLLAPVVKKTALALLPTLAVSGIFLWLARRASRPGRTTLIVGAGVIVLLVGLGLAAAIPAPSYADAWLARPDPQAQSRWHGDAVTGDYSLLVGNGASLVQRIRPALLSDVRGRQIVVTAQARSVSGGEQGGLFELITDRGRQSEPFTAAGEWRRAQLTAAIPDDAQIVRVALRAGYGMGLYLDDVSLTTLDGSGVPGANLLTNGSAEEAASSGQVTALAAAYALRLDAYLTPWFADPMRSVDWALLREGAAFLQRSFWGLFGSVNVAMPEWWNGIWPFASLVALLGLIGFVAENRRPRTAEKRQRVALMAALFCSVLFFVAQALLPMLNRPDPNWFPQGRFLFAAMAPIAVLLYAGWVSWLPPRLRGWLLPALFVALVILDGAVLWKLVQYNVY